ncbi:hypothetical protein NPX13_g10830 [Xylaria arbuscula]|uniref:Uncharacterized protein n=1 Tax=Xylaria arbuscula TaxID=114810 RepID=A0A9W8N427_9PEZI|nr:hypothetical protein NPX13_g10830 [Xylaria arbuscula]
MSNFVASLMGTQSSESSQDTPKATKSPAGEKQNSDSQSDNKTSNQNTSKSSDEASPGDDKLAKAAKDLEEKGHPEMSNFVASLVGDKPEQSQQAEQATDSRDVSKKADGTFRDTERNALNAQPNNKMGTPDVASISQEAQPAMPSFKSDSKSSSEQCPQINGNGQEKDDQNVFDNMGRPAQVNRRIEIPLQRPQKKENGVQQADGQKSNNISKDLGDFEDLPGVDDLPSTDDLPGKPEDDSPDPPEEFLDPSVHSTGAASIDPIPKIPKIPHIDASPPFNLERLAQGLAGYAVDDVGNIVDESGEVLGHATGDLPAMVGKKVSDNGEIYGDDDEIVGYVSDNFVNPPSPTEIPEDVIGGLRVDHKGNILDLEGNIIGKFNQPLGKNGSTPKPASKGDADNKPKTEQKPKINAQTGAAGSPSDLFLDVKSTNDGIQLTIRIPTMYSRPSSES